jgi:hypothetical protein
MASSLSCKDLDGLSDKRKLSGLLDNRSFHPNAGVDTGPAIETGGRDRTEDLKVKATRKKGRGHEGREEHDGYDGEIERCSPTFSMHYHP